MKTLQVHVKEANVNSANLDAIGNISPQLGFVFGSVGLFQNQIFINNLLEKNPEVKWVGCTTAGEISNKGVFDNSAVVTAVHFDKPTSKFRVAAMDLTAMEESLEVGRKLGQQLVGPDLRSVIIISPGVNVNGSMLVRGVVSEVGEGVTVTGGLAGDGGKFERTWTLSNEGVSDKRLIGIAFYGDGVQMTHGCMGGVGPFW